MPAWSRRRCWRRRRRPSWRPGCRRRRRAAGLQGRSKGVAAMTTSGGGGGEGGPLQAQRPHWRTSLAHRIASAGRAARSARSPAWQPPRRPPGGQHAPPVVSVAGTRPKGHCSVSKGMSTRPMACCMMVASAGSMPCERAGAAGKGGRRGEGGHDAAPGALPTKRGQVTVRGRRPQARGAAVGRKMLRTAAVWPRSLTTTC